MHRAQLLPEVLHGEVRVALALERAHLLDGRQRDARAPRLAAAVVDQPVIPAALPALLQPPQVSGRDPQGCLLPESTSAPRRIVFTITSFLVIAFTSPATRRSMLSIGDCVAGKGRHLSVLIPPDIFSAPYTVVPVDLTRQDLLLQRDKNSRGHRFGRREVKEIARADSV